MSDPFSVQGQLNDKKDKLTCMLAKVNSSHKENDPMCFVAPSVLSKEHEYMSLSDAHMKADPSLTLLHLCTDLLSGPNWFHEQGPHLKKHDLWECS